MNCPKMTSQFGYRPEERKSTVQSHLGGEMMPCQRIRKNPNPPSSVGIKTENTRLCSIPDHAQRFRCRASQGLRSFRAAGSTSQTPEGGAIPCPPVEDERRRTCPCESRDEAFMVHQGSTILLDLKGPLSFHELPSMHSSPSRESFEPMPQL